MNQLQMNVDGLLESLDSTLVQVDALISTTHHTVSGQEASLYLHEAGQLLLVARNLVRDAQEYRHELSRQLAAGEGE